MPLLRDSDLRVLGPGDELPFTVGFGTDGRADASELPSNRIYQ